jgi:hypothetical protein
MVNRILIEWDFEKPRPWFDKSRFCPGASRRDQARQALAAERPNLFVGQWETSETLANAIRHSKLGLWP